MNFILGLIVFICCVVFAYFLTLKYYYRQVFFNDFSTFNRRYKAEIIFSKKSIEEMLKNGYAGNGDFYSKLNDKENYLTIKYLSEEESHFLQTYVETIGKSDDASQLEFIESLEKYLEDKQKNCIDDYKRNKNLYLKIGFLIGLIMFIALI